MRNEKSGHFDLKHTKNRTADSKTEISLKKRGKNRSAHTTAGSLKYGCKTYLSD